MFCVCPVANKVKRFNVKGLQEIILGVNIRMKCSNISTLRFFVNCNLFMSLNTSISSTCYLKKVCCHVQ